MAAVKTDKYKFTKMEKVVWKYSGIIIRNNIVRSGGIGRRTQYTCPVPSGSVSLRVNYKKQSWAAELYPHGMELLQILQI